MCLTFSFAFIFATLWIVVDVQYGLNVRDVVHCSIVNLTTAWSVLYRLCISKVVKITMDA